MLQYEEQGSKSTQVLWNRFQYFWWTDQASNLQEYFPKLQLGKFPGLEDWHWVLTMETLFYKTYRQDIANFQIYYCDVQAINGPSTWTQCPWEPSPRLLDTVSISLTPMIIIIFRLGENNSRYQAQNILKQNILKHYNFSLQLCKNKTLFWYSEKNIWKIFTWILFTRNYRLWYKSVVYTALD